MAMGCWRRSSSPRRSVVHPARGRELAGGGGGVRLFAPEGVSTRWHILCGEGGLAMALSQKELKAVGAGSGFGGAAATATATARR